MIVCHKDTLEIFRAERRKGGWRLYSSVGLSTKTVTFTTFKRNYKELK